MAMLLTACFSRSTRAALPGTLTFKAGFLHGLAPWKATHGGAQCANYGTPSTAPRLRGYFSTGRFRGVPAARFDLPASLLPSFPLQACELTHPRALGLGTDDYYGYMFYVPKGWNTGAKAFWGVITAQFHFQNIWGAPIEFQLQRDHMTLALETGACNSYTVAVTGCQRKSDADVRVGGPGDLGARYVVPPPMRLGVWHEVIMHVRWASSNTGQIQIWHRIKGELDWVQTANLDGIPTVQWNVARGCCDPSAVDKIGAYRGLAIAPVSVWEANFTIGTSFPVVAATMPGPARSLGSLVLKW